MKKFLPFFLLFFLTGCDSDIDITKYPENIQKCFNHIYYSDNNCTKKQKIIIKFCECYNAKYSQKIQKEEEIYSKTVNLFGYDNFFSQINRLTASDRMNEISQEVSNDCAKRTGYTCK